MPTLISLSEAASFLGVSKATLRNWDKEGKLKAHRHPMNRYRAYDLEELRLLKHQTTSIADDAQTVTVIANSLGAVHDSRHVKRMIVRLHNVLRDSDGDSSIIQRFDELTKLLFLKLITEQNESRLYDRGAGEDESSYAARIRQAYNDQAQRIKDVIPQRFATLTCSDSAIEKCGSILCGLSFETAKFDVKGMAYEEVIKGTFDKSDNQQYFTPPPIVSFMVDMMQPFLKGVVADPACGTAGFLAEIARVGAPHTKLLGFEIDERLGWVAGVNLLIHGASDFSIKVLHSGGSLGTQGLSFFGKVDTIITNPPFGSEMTDPEVLNTFRLGVGRASRRRGILFIERCWDLLTDGGVVAIVIDEGVLNLSSAKDVRQFLLDRFEILAVVNLPDTAFMPYASVNASILLLRKSQSPDRSQRVFFARAEKVGRKPNGDEEIIYDIGGARLNSDLPEILQRWRSFCEGHLIGVDDLVFAANISDNLRDDLSLRLDFRYHHPSRSRSRSLLEASRFRLISLSELCCERNETVVPSTDMPDQTILYTGLANIEPNNGIAHQVATPSASLKSAVKRYEPGDIVFARMRPNLRKVALMRFDEGGYVSPECSVLSVRTNFDGEPLVDREVLAAVLRSDLVFGQITHLISGIGRPRLNATDLRKVQLPIPPLPDQVQSKGEYLGRIASAKQLRIKAAALLSEAVAVEQTAVDELAKRIIGE